MAAVEKPPAQRIASAGEDEGKSGPWRFAVGMENAVAPGRAARWLIRQFKTELPRDPATLLLGTNPKGLKAGSWREMCTPVFVAALFTVAKGESHPGVH